MSEKELHITIGDIVMNARANAFNAVVKAVAKADPDATVDVTATLFREAWQEATPPAEDLAEVPGSPVDNLRSKLREVIEDSLALTYREADDLIEKLVPAILSSNEMAEDMDRADALSCTLSQIRGIVEIAIDTIEEQDPCTVGTRMADATAALYGVVALAKARVDKQT